MDQEPKTKKKEKNDKKKKKEKKRKQEEEPELLEKQPKTARDGDHTKEKCDKDRQLPPTKKQKVVVSGKDARAARRLERKKLMELVPKTDENGIAYTKLQLRRMCKRVAKGLHPIESEAEKRERLRREAELRREEEMELAGMTHSNYINNGEESDQEEGENAQNHYEGGSEDENNLDNDGDNRRYEHDDKKDKMPVHSKGESAAKQSKNRSHRSKPVPHDYVCSACQNKHTPLHWIYDCPDKVTMRGTNQVSKKSRGIKNPDARKVFVSGLPFDVKNKDVEKIFAACGPVLHCKLIKFQDTGRCKGQAFVTLATEDAAKKALEMNGSVIENGNVKQVKNGELSPPTRKELKLRVTKTLNRSMTKRSN